jgi:hypothetical protein
VYGVYPEIGNESTRRRARGSAGFPARKATRTHWTLLRFEAACEGFDQWRLTNVLVATGPLSIRALETAAERRGLASCLSGAHRNTTVADSAFRKRGPTAGNVRSECVGTSVPQACMDASTYNEEVHLVTRRRGGLTIW